MLFIGFNWRTKNVLLLKTRNGISSFIKCGTGKVSNSFLKGAFQALNNSIVYNNVDRPFLLRFPVILLYCPYLPMSLLQCLGHLQNREGEVFYG